MCNGLARLARCAGEIRECTRGNSFVEFAWAAPILVLLTFASFDYGSAYVEGLRLNGAARAGTQQALHDPVDWNNTAKFKQAALEEYAGQPLTSEEAAALAVTAAADAYCACTAGATLACADICPDSSDPGRFVRVTLSRDLSLILPYPWTASEQLTVQGESVIRVR